MTDPAPDKLVERLDAEWAKGPLDLPDDFWPQAKAAIQRLTEERDDWKQAHQELVEVRTSDLQAVAAKMESVQGEADVDVAKWIIRAELQRKRAEKAEAERDEARRFAAEWHQICDTICTVNGLGLLDAKDVAGAVRDKFDGLEAERDRLRAALEWYANPEIYKPHPHGPAFDGRDLSFKARAALTGEVK